MKKPVNENRNDVFAENTSNEIKQLKSEISKAQQERLQDVIETVYKEGYLDGIRDAIYFAQI